MEAILKYNLPDDQLDFDTAVNGAKWMAAMWQLDNWLRSQTKHPPEGMSDDIYNALVNTRDKLHEILQEEGLKL